MVITKESLRTVAADYLQVENPTCHSTNIIRASKEEQQCKDSGN